MSISAAPISAAAVSASVTPHSDISGIAVIAEADDTIAAVGALPIVGAAAITEDGDTLAATAALAIVGEASLSEADDTLTAAGVLPLVGSADITEAGDALSATGALALVGAAAITEEADTVLATAQYGTYGRLVTQGRGSNRIGISANPICAAEVSGAFQPELLFAQEDNDTLVSAARLLTHGAASITEAADTMVAAGQRRRTLRAGTSSSAPRIGGFSSSAPRIGGRSSSGPRIKIRSAA